jgi:peptide deformylase
MWETMYNADGVGLAAPQIGRSIRLFIVDTQKPIDQSNKDEKPDKGVKQVFINARRIEETGEPWTFEEGCLSIPDIRGDVDRPESIRLQYLDENFQMHEDVFEGINARVIQHEYDHLEGILFTELLKPIKKQLIKRRLEKIKKGEISVDYKMKFSRK